MAGQPNKAVKISDGYTIVVSGEDIQAGVQESGYPAVVGNSTTNPFVGIIIDYDQRSNTYTLAIKGMYQTTITIPPNKTLHPGDILYYSPQSGFIPSESGMEAKNVVYVGESTVEGGQTGTTIKSKILLR